jgi:hypothetical protein
MHFVFGSSVAFPGLSSLFCRAFFGSCQGTILLICNCLITSSPCLLDGMSLLTKAAINGPGCLLSCAIRVPMESLPVKKVDLAHEEVVQADIMDNQWETPAVLPTNSELCRIACRVVVVTFKPRALIGATHRTYLYPQVLCVWPGAVGGCRGLDHKIHN